MNFRDQYEQHVSYISESMINFPWHDKLSYAKFLAQTYYYTRHSTKLLTLASSRFDFDDYDLHRRFITHSQEERGHEFMCLKDLSVLGFDIKNFPEFAGTSAFYQRQYFLIEHVDPICFLGYVLCLEGLSAKAAGPACSEVKKTQSEKSTLFLRAHSDEDPDHIDKAFKALDGLSDHRLGLVLKNLEISCILYSNVMAEAKVSTGAPAIIMAA